MTIPTNRMAYEDVYKHFDAALADARGIRIPFDTHAQAKHYQMRMHNARAVDRRDSKRIYKPDDHMYGQSIYDTLQVIIREGDDGTHFVYVEPRNKHIGEFESLSEVEDDTTETAQ
jgi:hypothetical protein